MLLRRERDLRIGPKPPIFTVADNQPDALRASAKIQRIIAGSRLWKPILAIHLPPHRGEARKQVLGFRSTDLWNGLAFAANNREVGFVYPNQAVEQALPLQELARANLHHPARHSFDRFLATIFGFV